MYGSSSSDDRISDRQLQFEAALKSLAELLARGQLPRQLEPLKDLAPRPGFAARVVLHHADESDPSQLGRDIKDDAGAHWWSPTAGHVARVWYEPESAQSRAAANKSSATSLGQSRRDPQSQQLPGDVRELVLELDRAERSGMPYVVLTWFRDTCLPASGLPWAGKRDDPIAKATRQRALSKAIELGLVLTDKVSNPNNPAQLATTIRVNDGHPLNAILLSRTPDLPEFQPVPIRGEPLSEAIIRERR